MDAESESKVLVRGGAFETELLVRLSMVLWRCGVYAPMPIIAGRVRVAEADRDAYVTAHCDLVERGRKAAGFPDVVISADPLDPRRVNLFERWESQEALDAWRAVANAPDPGDRVRRRRRAAVHRDARSPFD